MMRFVGWTVPLLMGLRVASEHSSLGLVGWAAAICTGVLVASCTHLMEREATRQGYQIVISGRDVEGRLRLLYGAALAWLLASVGLTMVLARHVLDWLSR
jgi:hypothetical protein